VKKIRDRSPSAAVRHAQSGSAVKIRHEWRRPALDVGLILDSARFPGGCSPSDGRTDGQSLSLSKHWHHSVHSLVRVRPSRLGLHKSPQLMPPTIRPTTKAPPRRGTVPRSRRTNYSCSVNDPTGILVFRTKRPRSPLSVAY